MENVNSLSNSYTPHLADKMYVSHTPHEEIADISYVTKIRIRIETAIREKSFVLYGPAAAAIGLGLSSFCAIPYSSAPITLGALSLAYAIKFLPEEDPVDTEESFIAKSQQYHREYYGNRENLYLLTVKDGPKEHVCQRTMPGVYMAHLGGNRYKQIIGENLPLTAHRIDQTYLQTMNHWKSSSFDSDHVIKLQIRNEGKLKGFFETFIGGDRVFTCTDPNVIIPDLDIRDIERRIRENNPHDQIEQGLEMEDRMTGVTMSSYPPNRIFVNREFCMDGEEFYYYTPEGYEVFNDGSFGNMAVVIDNKYYLATYHVHPVTGQEYLMYRKEIGRMCETYKFFTIDLYRSNLPATKSARK